MPEPLSQPLPPPTTAPDEVVDYVRASARFLDLPLDEAQTGRVALHLTRTKAMVALLREFPLVAEDEPAEIYCPAPFPARDTP